MSTTSTETCPRPRRSRFVPENARPRRQRRTQRRILLGSSNYETQVSGPSRWLPPNVESRPPVVETPPPVVETPPVSIKQSDAQGWYKLRPSTPTPRPLFSDGIQGRDQAISKAAAYVSKNDYSGTIFLVGPFESRSAARKANDDNLPTGVSKVAIDFNLENAA